MGELTSSNEGDIKSPDSRPWGEKFPSRRAFKRYALRRYEEETQSLPKVKIKPELTTITAVDIAKFWNIDWDHIVYSQRPRKTFGNINSTIDYLYSMLKVAIDDTNPHRDALINDSFLLKPTGDIFNGTHRAASLILIGPQFLQKNGLSNLVKPTIVT